MIDPETVREFMVLDAMAKMLAAKARSHKLNLQESLVNDADGLKGMSVGEFELRLGHSTVDWNADIIQTITEIDGVSEEDKADLFHPPVKKANGVKLNSYHKKYGGTVAKRIDQAREESGVSLKITSKSRVVQHSITQEAIKRLSEKENNEGENTL